jgi:hypothetical protein
MLRPDRIIKARRAGHRLVRQLLVSDKSNERTVELGTPGTTISA